MKCCCFSDFSPGSCWKTGRIFLIWYSLICNAWWITFFPFSLGEHFMKPLSYVCISFIIFRNTLYSRLKATDKNRDANFCVSHQGSNRKELHLIMQIDICWLSTSIQTNWKMNFEEGTFKAESGFIYTNQRGSGGIGSLWWLKIASVSNIKIWFPKKKVFKLPPGLQSYGHRHFFFQRPGRKCKEKRTVLLFRHTQSHL